MSNHQTPVALIVLDGWGYRADPTHNAIELGRTLTDTYDSLQQLYVASVLELARTPGMTAARAVRIQAALELGRRMMAMSAISTCCDDATALMAASSPSRLIRAAMPLTAW